MDLVVQVFQQRESKETLAMSYLVLQACISFFLFRRFRQEWRISVFACSHKNAAAHMSINVAMPADSCGRNWTLWLNRPCYFWGVSDGERL